MIGSDQIHPFDRATRAASARVVAPVFLIAAERLLRVVPTERWARAAITATGEPSSASSKISDSRVVSGVGPDIIDSAARSGSGGGIRGRRDWR